LEAISNLRVLGEGSSFYFSLDFPISTLQESLEDKPLVKYDASKLMNKKDSCGWDNKINQMILRKCSSKGITCEIIDNGEEALMY
jgi:hypothetical protein